jgi:hypothetical protein
VHSGIPFISRDKSALYLSRHRQVMYAAVEPPSERAGVLEIIGGHSAHGGRSKLSLFHYQLAAPISSERKMPIIENPIAIGSHWHAFLSYRSIHTAGRQQSPGKSDAESL